MKTLDQVEARTIVSASSTPGDATSSFVIAAPGSYYLIENITATPGKHGISIRANDVTLDLNGFALLGGGSASCGVNVPVAQSGFCIRNGSVRGWGSGGVQASAAVTLAENLQLSENAGPAGLAVGNGSLVNACVATGNNVGFLLPDRTQISNCIATVNSDRGFVCTSYVSLIDCTASRNFGGGGIFTDASCSIIRCTSTRNLPRGQGIVTGADCTIADCLAGSNGSDGISVDAGCTVRGCTASGNGSRGIGARNGSSYIALNTCDRNGHNGIDIDDNSPKGGNRIDGNSCSRNAGFGFLVQGSFSNIVMRNSASQNGQGSSDYQIGRFNSTGPIVNARQQFSDPVKQQAQELLSTSSPWANFIN